MKKDIILSSTVYRVIAAGYKTTLRLPRCDEPDIGLVRLWSCDEAASHIDVLVTKKKKVFQGVKIRFTVLGVYGVY